MDSKMIVLVANNMLNISYLMMEDNGMPMSFIQIFIFIYQHKILLYIMRTWFKPSDQTDENLQNNQKQKPMYTLFFLHVYFKITELTERKH